jgi:septal ring factor EnvC (AmiA/AmiB activator)
MDTEQTDTPAIPDAIWRCTVTTAINEALSLNLPDSADAYTVANAIVGGVRDLHKWQGQAADVARSVTAERDELAGKLADVTTERDNTQVALIGARSLYGTLLDDARVYRQTLADHLGVPYDTAKDAAALCDALIPRLMTESAAVESAAFAATVLPDALPADDDGDTPSPARTIRLLADALRSARRDIARTNEALNTARAEADALRSTLAATQADLRATDRARDSWRDAAGASARALSLAASALADVAAIR